MKHRPIDVRHQVEQPCTTTAGAQDCPNRKTALTWERFSLHLELEVWLDDGGAVEIINDTHSTFFSPSFVRSSIFTSRLALRRLPGSISHPVCVGWLVLTKRIVSTAEGQNLYWSEYKGEICAPRRNVLSGAKRREKNLIPLSSSSFVTIITHTQHPERSCAEMGWKTGNAWLFSYNLHRVPIKHWLLGCPSSSASLNEAILCFFRGVRIPCN